MSRRKMKLTPEARLAFVERYKRHEATINSLAERSTSSAISTMNRWIAIYDNEGPTGL